ncbi:uncharacterized protein [Palaemon carinicauda]|uniref:uncharacterized protein n=1 Tax=Palaemon carinicauda TaxID=392227 RepID=UPI0035B5DBDB
MSRFSVPDDITTEQGSIFLSEIWLSLVNLMGTTLYSTIAYNPAVNDIVERAHRTLKAALYGEMYERTLENLDHLREIAGKFRPCLKTYEDRTTHFTPKNLDDCDYVDAHRQPLTRPYRGPYEVVRTAKFFLLNFHRQENWVRIDRLKPAYLESHKKITAGPGRPMIPPQNKSSTRREKTT